MLASTNLSIARRTTPIRPDADAHPRERLAGDPDVWIFIIAELLTFGAFFVAYIVYRAYEVEIFDASQLTLDRHLGVLNTVILFTSSWAVVRAVNAARRDEPELVSRHLAIAVVLALAFVVVKGFEYSAKFAHGVSMTTNTFYMFYFCFTGIHLLHVVGGGVILSVLCSKARRGDYHSRNVMSLEAGASYWHMVDLLWIFLFALLYLLR